MGQFSAEFIFIMFFHSLLPQLFYVGNIKWLFCDEMKGSQSSLPEM